PPRSKLFPYTTLFRSERSGSPCRYHYQERRERRSDKTRLAYAAFLLCRHGQTPEKHHARRTGIAQTAEERKHRRTGCGPAEKRRSEEHTSELQSRFDL